MGGWMVGEGGHMVLLVKAGKGLEEKVGGQKR